MYHVPQMQPLEAEKLLLKFTGSASTAGADIVVANLVKVGGI